MVGINGSSDPKFDLSNQSALKSKLAWLDGESSKADRSGDIGKSHGFKEEMKAIASQMLAQKFQQEANGFDALNQKSNQKNDEVIKIDLRNTTEQLAQKVHGKDGANQAGEHGFRETKHGPMRNLGQA